MKEVDIVTTVEILADYVLRLRTDSLPYSSLKVAKHAIVDLIGAAIAGHRCSTASILLKTAQNSFSSGSSSVWFYQQKLNKTASAMINSASASALDIDDGHRQAGGHPGAAIIPAAFALSQHLKSAGTELIASIIIGYEIAVRIARSRDFSVIPTYSTGRWCSFGVAAVAGRLYGSNMKELAHSLSIAGIQAPDMAAAGYSKCMGNNVKEGIPWSVMTGIFAHELGSNGFSGPLDILDHPLYYDSEKILAGLNDAAFLIEETYFKPYACCRWIHSSIDALLDIMENHRIEKESIQRIDVAIFSRALTLNNHRDPDSLEAAQYSIPFCLAVAATEGRRGLLPLSHNLLHRPDVVSFANKVNLIEAPNFNSFFPRKTPAHISLQAITGKFEKTVFEALGEPDNPMSFSLLKEKFYQLSLPHISKKKANEIIEAVRRLEESDLEKLYGLLD